MNEKLIIILVGLPARGKSYTSNHINRFLNWCDLKCKVFNSGNYRRDILGGFQDSNFFDFSKKENFNKKEEISKICFNDLINWLEKDGDIAIFDATNSTEERRKYLIDNNKNINTIFIELITDNQDIITKNLDLKKLSPDYFNKDKDFAQNDFLKRQNFYKKIYQSINDDENLKYIKIINFTEKLIINNIYGINETLILSYLMNLRLNKHPIYLSRHGESINNINNIIGGDCDLSEKGFQYSIKLSEYIQAEINDDFVLFTSCLKRTNQTASKIINNNRIKTRLLNEIHAGICENLTMEEIKENYPNIIKSRKENKLKYRYPEGESYLDLIERLKYFIIQLGSYNKPIVIIAHNAILKVLLGYFQGNNIKDIPHIEIKLHEIIKLTPNSVNYNINKIKLL